MSPFQSRLEVVIRHHHHRELEAMQAFAEKRSILVTQEAVLGALQTGIDEATRDLIEKTTHGIVPEEITLYHQYLRRQYLRVQDQRQAVDRLNHECEISRQELIETTRQKKLVEKVYEHRKTIFNKKLEKKQQNFMDEIANRRSEELK